MRIWMATAAALALSTAACGQDAQVADPVEPPAATAADAEAPAVDAAPRDVQAGSAEADAPAAQASDQTASADAASPVDQPAAGDAQATDPVAAASEEVAADPIAPEGSAAAEADAPTGASQAEVVVEGDAPAADGTPEDVAAAGDAVADGEPAQAADGATVDAEEGAVVPADGAAASDEIVPQDETVSGDGAVEDGAAAALADGEEALEDEAALEEEPVVLTPAERIGTLIEAGGPVLIILAVLSVLTLTITFVKLTQFTVLRVGDRGVVAKAMTLVRDGREPEAHELLARSRGPLPHVLLKSLECRSAPAATEQKVRDEIERIAQEKLEGLERGLPALSLIATVSPLLGLLGTVLGMIEAFQQMQMAGDRVDPAILSGGIWEALITTAAGLAVAIPAAAFFTWLQRTVDVAAQHMEDAAAQAFTVDLYLRPANEAAEAPAPLAAAS